MANGAGGDVGSELGGTNGVTAGAGVGIGIIVASGAGAVCASAKVEPPAANAAT